MHDGEITDLFFQRSESAIDELSKKYGKLCSSIARNITGNEQDAQECVNDAYLAAWNTIPPARPDPLAAYVCRLVRNLSINRYKFNHSKKRNTDYDLCLCELENTLFDSGGLDESMDDSSIAARINEYLSALCEGDRVIFLRRFWYFDSYKKISQMTNIKEGTIRTRISRIKSGLRDYLSEKGVII